MTPFSFLTDINHTKKDLMVDDITENIYDSFLINRSLSYFRDTTLAANLMNQYHLIDKKLQYHFLINIVRKQKRFSKWIKPETIGDLEAVKEYYGYSNEKAKLALSLLTTDNINELKKRIHKGGRI